MASSLYTTGGADVGSSVQAKTLVLKSDSTAVQNLTTGFVTMKQADNTTDSSVTPESGKTYEIEVAWLCGKTGAGATIVMDFEVRAGATVLGKSTRPYVRDDGDSADAGGQIRIVAASGTVAYRAACKCGVFVSDGTAVKLYVKASATGDTPYVDRGQTYVLLRELTS